MLLPEFLDLLDQRHVAYRLERVRDAVMVVVATPGTRWEVEFLDSGGVEVERFDSDGTLGDEAMIETLMAERE